MAVEQSDVRVRLLGPVTVERGDTERPLGSGRRQAVLAVLALHPGHAVSREELIAAVWGEDPPASAPGNLYTYVSELRRAIDPGRARGLLTSGGGSYCLHLPADAVDVLRMCALLDEARTGRPAGQLATVEAALSLWRGDALAGVPGPFAAAERLRLVELFLAGAERRATLQLQLGRPGDAVGPLRELVDHHPVRESARAVLMTALQRLGRPAEALRVYDELTVRLAEETGTEPGEALRRIVAGLRDTAATDPSGRSSEVGVLRRAVTALAGGRGGSVWVEGEAGIGKTTVLAAGLAGAGPRCGWGTGDELTRAVPLGALIGGLEEFGPVGALRDGPTVDRVVARVRELCAGGPLILVLDDLQWTDETTRPAWRALHDLTGRCPLLLVGAARPAVGDRSLTLLRRAVTEAGAETIRLGALAGAAEAGGNPYYQKHLAAAGGELSPALMAAVAAHLDVHDEATRAVLRALAFLGDGTPAELATVTGRAMPDLLRAVEAAAGAGLLAVAADGRLEFRHPVVRRVLHDGTPAALRVMLHREMAERIARSAGRPERVVAQLLAGPAPVDGWVTGWVAGHAEQVVARDPEAAIAILRRTGSAAAEPAVRETLTAWLARVLFWQGAGGDAEAARVAGRTADPELAAEMGWIIALGRHQRAEHTAAVDGVLAALRGGRLPERWQAHYRQLLVRLTPYVSEVPSLFPLAERIPVIR